MQSPTFLSLWLMFFTSIIKLPATVSQYCFTLCFTVLFCLHLLTEEQITFFFFFTLLTGTNFWLTHNYYFCQVALASSCLSGRHKSVPRSHIDSFITVIILKSILPMQHNSIKKPKKYKLIYWFPLTFSLAASNKWDRKGKQFTTYRLKIK